MSLVRIVVAAFAGAALAIVMLLAWRASKATGRSLRASFSLVPSEAQRLYMDAKTSRPAEMAKSGWDKVAEEL